jgi:hypothetical protein
MRAFVPMNLSAIEDNAARTELQKAQDYLRQVDAAFRNLIAPGNYPPVNPNPTNPPPGSPTINLVDYLFLPGRPAGQIAYGGNSAGNFLKLRSTRATTKGKIFLGSTDVTAYDDVNQRFGIGTASPVTKLHVLGTNAVVNAMRPVNSVSNSGGAGPDWTPSTGASLSDCIDDPITVNTDVSGDGDWIISSTSSSSAGSIEFSVVTNPGSTSNWFLRYRAQKVLSGTGNVTFSLKQGVTVIESWTDTITDFSSPGPYSHSFSAVNIANIVFPLLTPLHIEMSPGGVANQQIKIFVWFLEVPGGAGPGTTVIARFEGGVGQDVDWLQLKLNGGNILGMKVPATLTTHSLTWPAVPVNNGFLKTDTNGILSWDTTPGAHNLLSATHTDTVAHVPVLGDIIAANSTPAWAAVAGNITTTRKFLRQTGGGAVSALPAWDTIVAADVPGAALTKTDDTNVTLTLGGSPTVALLAATSLTLGWTGTLAIARGGTGAGTALAGFNALSPLTTRGDLLTRDASNNVRLGLGTAKQVLAVNAGATDPAWASLDNTYLADRLRHIWLPPNVFSQSNGTAATLQAINLSATPKAVVEWNWVDAPAVGPQAYTTQFIIPQDYVSGTTIQVFVHWSELSANLTDLKWVFRYSFIVLGNKENMNGTWTGPTAQVIVDNGFTGSGGDYDVGVANYHAVKQHGTDIPSTGLAAGKFVILTVDRLSTDANDTLNKTVEFLGIELRYSADM